MTAPIDDDRRDRPPPATGRQDRHRNTSARRPVRPVEPEPYEADAPGAHVAPRGFSYYQEQRTRPYGLGCLVALGAGALVAALALVLLGLMTDQAGIGTDAPPLSFDPPPAEAPEDVPLPGGADEAPGQ